MASHKRKEEKEEEKPQVTHEDKTKRQKKEEEEKKNHILETGHIYFFYRPKISHDTVKSFEDVGRFYVVLVPKEGSTSKGIYRLLLITKKKLPDVHKKKHERFWGFVDKAASDVGIIDKRLEEEHYETKTKGERTTEACRPAGEGFYAIVQHERVSIEIGFSSTNLLRVTLILHMC
jgi:hypothetical protein